MIELYRLFGAAVKQGRLDAGWTQEDLANRVGLSRTSITNIEKGKQSVLLHTVYDLAAALKKRPEDLLPPAEVLSASRIQEKKLREIDVSEHDRELLGKLLRDAERLRSDDTT